MYCNRRKSRRLDLSLSAVNESRKRSYSSRSNSILRRRSENRARASSALKLKSVFTRKINVKTKREDFLVISNNIFVYSREIETRSVSHKLLFSLLNLIKLREVIYLLFFLLN